MTKAYLFQFNNGRSSHLRTGFFEKIGSFWTSPYFLWLIILFGVALRFAQYLHNRSLWHDEATIALDIMGRTFRGFFQPSTIYNQTSPLGFLVVEKVMVQLFGSGEYALRLFPFVCGIISLPVFYGVAKRVINEKAIPIALGLFVMSQPLIYFSSELKHYSCDMAMALLLLWVIACFRSKPLRITGIVFLALIVS